MTWKEETSRGWGLVDILRDVLYERVRNGWIQSTDERRGETSIEGGPFVRRRDRNGLVVVRIEESLRAPTLNASRLMIL